MRAFATMLFSCLFISVFMLGSTATTAAADDAPAFTYKDKSGTEQKLSNYEGKKVVVVDFWAMWCGPCKDALPGFKKLGDEYKEKDVVFIAMNLGEDRRNVLRYLIQNNLKDLTVGFDTAKNAPGTFSFRGIPHCIVIDKDGKITYRGHPALKDELRKAVNAALN